MDGKKKSEVPTSGPSEKEEWSYSFKQRRLRKITGRIDKIIWFFLFLCQGALASFRLGRALKLTVQAQGQVFLN